MRWDDEQHTNPCAKCPYRKDAPLGLWHRSEFENLLAHDADERGGALFLCHGDGKLPPAQQRPCVGWLLEQRHRGLPSIHLRMALFQPGAPEALERMTDGGLELFPSIRAMCRANGVHRARKKND